MRNYMVLICLVLSLFLLPTVIADCADSRKELAAKIIELSENAKYEQALEQADKFIVKYNNASFGYLAKGHALSDLYRIEEAMENYKKALQYIPDRVKKGLIYTNIANNYIRLNNFDDAINYYRLAIEADDKLFALNMLGISNAYILKGDMVQALSYYKNARERLDESAIRSGEASNANTGKVYMSAAWITYQLGNNNEALEYAEKGKDLRNTDRARLIYASYLARIGNEKKAVQKFASVNVDNCPAGELSLFYLFIGDNEKASKYFNISYAEMKTPDQIKFRNLSFKRDAMYPYGDWAKARNQEWFKAKIQG